MRVLCVVTIVVFLFLSISSCNTAQDQSEITAVKKVGTKLTKPLEKNKHR